MDTLTTAAQVNLYNLALKRLPSMANQELMNVLDRPLSQAERSMVQYTIHEHLASFLNTISNIILRNPEAFEKTLTAEANDLADIASLALF